MANKSRSMDEALTPQEKEFFDLGKAPKNNPASKTSAEVQTLQVAPSTREQAQVQQAENITMVTQFSAGGSINARGVDPALTTALMRASLERRIQRVTPSTHREIIIEAITDWLKKHSYLG